VFKRASRQNLKTNGMEKESLGVLDGSPDRWSGVFLRNLAFRDLARAATPRRFLLRWGGGEV
jgi:hypothetical protein